MSSSEPAPFRSTGFYARRARRLLPAAALCLFVTVAVSALVLPPLRVPDVSADGVAAALYVSNLRFAFEATDYLRAEVAPSPLLHYWSLGVEEQFYLLWPALLLLVTRGGGAVVRRVGIAAAVVGVVSLVLSLWLTTANAPWAFYSLPTRAWELGIGALLAVGAARLARIPPRASRIALWAGLGLIVLSGVAIGTSTPFPGVAALLPTIGAGLVILAGSGAHLGTTRSPLDRRPLRFLGRISYSLYLWHWPLLVLPAAALGMALPLPATLALAALAIPIAAASQRWVEEPIRHGRVVGLVPRRSLAAAGALTLVLVVTSTSFGGAAEEQPRRRCVDRDRRVVRGRRLHRSPAGPARRADLGRHADTTPDGAGHAEPGALRWPRAGQPRAVAGRREAGPAADLRRRLPRRSLRSDAGRVRLRGPRRVHDRRAHGRLPCRAMVPGVRRLGRERHWRLVSLTKSGCPPAEVTIWVGTFERAYTECDEWREAVFARIADLQPDLVVVSMTYGQTPIVDGKTLDGEPAREVMIAAYKRTLDRLDSIAGRVALLADTPRAPDDPPICLSSHLDDALSCATARQDAVEGDWLEEQQGVAEAEGAAFVDPTPWVCPVDPCPAVIGRYLVYRDTHHLTTTYAMALRNRLAAALPVPAAQHRFDGG